VFSINHRRDMNFSLLNMAYMQKESTNPLRKRLMVNFVLEDISNVLVVANFPLVVYHLPGKVL